MSPTSKILATRLWLPWCGCQALDCIRRLAHSSTCQLETLHTENAINDSVVVTMERIDEASLRPSVDTCLVFLQGCIDHKALVEGHHVHSHFVQNSILPNTSLENCLIEMYARCEHMDDACSTFHRMSDRDVTSWNTIISGFSQCRKAEKAFDYFSSMVKEGFQPDQVTFLNVLKQCAILQNITYGTQIHTHILKTEKDVGAFVGNGLIDMYINCGSPEDALKVFWGMAERDLVSWNMLICGYSKGGWYSEALKIFWRLISEGKRPNRITFLGVIKAAAGLGCLDNAKQIHDFLLKYKMEPVLCVGSSLIDMYNKCDRPELAREIFDKLPERNVVVWTSMIAGYVQHEHHEEALKLFWRMEREGVAPNEVTFITILKACCCASALASGKEIHELVRREGLESSAMLQCCLVDMYSKCGSVEDALCVCDQMLVQEKVLWNGMIAAYVSYGHHKHALTLFLEMEQRGVETNEVTFVSVVKACTNMHLVAFGKQVHLKMIETKADDNTILNNTLVDFYHKCGDIDGAFRVFAHLPERDAVSWNIVMAGYAVREDMEEVLALYRQMQQEGVQPDGVTYLSMLLSCGSLGALELGEQFHACVVGGFDEPAMPVCNTLIDMYAKCGSIEKSVSVFKSMPNRTSISWNIVILGCAQHGWGKEAFQLLERMKEEEVKVDHVTLLAIISACSYAGFVADGCFYFTLMTHVFGILPGEEVCASMVDMFGRAGQLEASKVCMVEMGGAVYPEVWKALLAACRIHCDWMLAKFAADRVLALEPENSGALVLWSNICAESADV
ncbi:hypothetical protein GOP47_0001210 [Adiantum capillus-veneris]|uniref:Pentatricopeptide repeat-containing protein n=1 Tax=Adiantum capillus-veneris TaxID=13818 RepID=A0A9D4VG73_ADICA|nr:hypothetical protein GOP47_0001210 [Adiantum capillus-veneris]